MLKRSLPHFFAFIHDYFTDPQTLSALWNVWYSQMAEYFSHPWWVFMNYGFAYPSSSRALSLLPDSRTNANEEDGEQEKKMKKDGCRDDDAMPTENKNIVELLKQDEEDRYFIQMYHWTATLLGGVEGRNVLEVGCGRGGGASYISRYLKPKAFTGLDFSLRYCFHCALILLAFSLRLSLSHFLTHSLLSVALSITLLSLTHSHSHSVNLSHFLSVDLSLSPTY